MTASLVPPQEDIDLFVLAAKEQKMDVIEFLLDTYDATIVDARDSDKGDTALSWAGWNGDCPMIEALLNHGANIELGDRNERSPLFCAILMDRQEAAALLVASGATLDTRDTAGRTLDQMAEQFSRTDLVETLRNSAPATRNVTRTPLQRQEQINASRLDTLRTIRPAGGVMGKRRPPR